MNYRLKQIVDKYPACKQIAWCHVAPARPEARTAHFEAQLLPDPAIVSRCHAPAGNCRIAPDIPKNFVDGSIFENAAAENEHLLKTDQVVDKGARVTQI